MPASSDTAASDPAAPQPAAASPDGDGDLPERIVAAATRLFAARGYAGVSVREICEAAGTTKPMLYYYFGSKAGLYRSLFVHIFDRFFELLTHAEQAELPLRDVLMRFAEAHLRWVRESPDHARFVFASSLGPRKGTPAVDLEGFRERNTAQLVKLIRRSQAKGELVAGAPEDLTFTFLGAVVMACIRCLEPDLSDPLSPSERARQLVDLFLSGAAGPNLERTP